MLFAWGHLIKLKKTIKNSLVKGIIVNPVRTLLSPTDLITYGHLCEETQEKFWIKNGQNCEQLFCIYIMDTVHYTNN